MANDEKLAGGSERKGTGGEAAGLAPVDKGVGATLLQLPSDANLTEAVAAKKLVAQARQRHSVHVNLIMLQTGKSKTEAQFLAYFEGADGYRLRLAGSLT